MLWEGEGMNEASCQGPSRPLVLGSGDALPLQRVESCRYLLVQEGLGFTLCVLLRSSTGCATL